MAVLTLPNAGALALTVRAKALVFEDAASKALLTRVQQIAPSDATALITGETGTGKEIIARHLHDLSGRRAKAFVGVNCSAFPESLIESELFGHERGAFTGALTTKKGWFETAEGGTLFLDEIGDLSPAVQVKLLRVLQEREVVRLGSRTATPIDVRLVAATNVDLRDAVLSGRFREDLYYRLNVAAVVLPPLRDRPGDILPLARYFLKLYAQRLGMASSELDEDAEARLLQHPWPGNIRELENVIHSALMVCRDGRVAVEDLRLTMPLFRDRSGARQSDALSTPPPSALTGFPALEAALTSLFDQPRDDLFARIEETVMRLAYEHSERNQLQTARLLGLSRNVVRARLLQIGAINGSSRHGAPGVSRRGTAAGPGRSVRLGYQRFGLLWLLRASGALDRALVTQGAEAAWTEFPSGVELVEALRIGELDLGVVGEGPPLLAQAKDGAVVYLAAEPPAPLGEAIVVRKESDVERVADLRGKRVMLNRGANVHYLLLRALEEAGLSLSDIDVVFASPAEGRKAFETGRTDAWVIWDPWLAAVEQTGNARILRDATGLASNRAYYVARRAFAQANPALIDLFIGEVRALGRTANDNTEAVAELLAPQVGVEKRALLTALRRNPLGLRLFDAELAAAQQRVADSSHRHHLIARPVTVADAGWVRPSTHAP